MAIAMGGCADTEGMYGDANLCAGYAASVVDQLNGLQDAGPRIELMRSYAEDYGARADELGEQLGISADEIRQNRQNIVDLAADTGLTGANGIVEDCITNKHSEFM